VISEIGGGAIVCPKIRIVTYTDRGETDFSNTLSTGIATANKNKCPRRRRQGFKPKRINNHE
jgi:hypothetical protein